MYCAVARDTMKAPRVLARLRRRRRQAEVRQGRNEAIAAVVVRDSVAVDLREELVLLHATQGHAPR